MMYRFLLPLYIFAALWSVFFCSVVDMTGGSSSTDNGRIMRKICSEGGLP